jgi:DNA-binding winged helix-turn-helix (wHTH) protein
VRFEFANFVLDESAHELRCGGEVLRIEPKALEILRHMLRRPGELVTKEDLVKHVWEGRALSRTVLTGTVSRLRAALGHGAREELIVNVYGRGYRFAGAVRQRNSVAMQGNDEKPFVGRSVVLPRVQQCLEQARMGRGRIVVIAGEAGIGKTRLAEISSERASELGVPSAWGLCREIHAAPPLWPFVQLLRGALRTSSSSTPARARVDSILSALATERNPPAGWSVGAYSHRLFEDFTRALQSLTDEGPLLLVLDDLQWADAASMRLLAYLVPEIAHMRLAILTTVRNTEPLLGDRALAPILRHRNCEYIELARLTEADVAEYTELALGPAHGEIGRAVFAKSEGNPFFMVELLRPFRRSAPPRIDELALTGPVLDVVRDRLRSLGVETTPLLSAAAVVGHDFDLGLLDYVSEVAPEAILDVLDAACQRGIILAASDRPGQFAFGHDLVRDVLLKSLSPSQRTRLHLRAAEALERRHPVGEGVPRPELVHHMLAALPLGDTEKVVDYASRAARAAVDVCAHADATNLLRRALAALDLARDVNARLRCDVLLGLSFCERHSADERFHEHLSEAVALGREHGLGAVLVAAGRNMAPAPGLTAMKGAREVLEATDRALPPDAHLLRSDLMAHLSWTPPCCFDAELAASSVARAEELALKSRDSNALAVALSARIHLAMGPDSQDLAATISNQIDHLYAERPQFFRAHRSAHRQFSRIVMSLQQGDVEAVEQSIVAFGAAARELRHPELEWHHERAGVIHRMNRGRFLGLEADLQDLHDRAAQQHLFSQYGVRAVDWSVLMRETDATSPGISFERVLVPQEGDCPYRWARKIRSLAELGAIDQARTLLHEMRPEALERLPRDRDYLGTLIHFTIASTSTRSQAHAEVLCSLLSPYPHLYAADLSLHCDGSVSHFLGMLARSLGRGQEAAKHFERALESNERAGFAPRTAHSAYELGRVLSDSASSRGVTRARTLFVRVLEMTREMGMGPLARSAQQQLQSS